MTDCVFCKIIKEEISADKIYEDDKVFAFLDINPVNLGHALLIPKEHYPIMTDTPDETLQYIYTKAKHLMKIIKEATGADYVVLSVVGIDVPHFHIHLVPRYKNDRLANFWPTKKYKTDEAKIVANKIKRLL